MREKQVFFLGWPYGKVCVSLTHLNAFFFTLEKDRAKRAPYTCSFKVHIIIN